MFQILQGLLRPQRRLLVVAAAVLLFATACSGSDSTPDAAAADAESTSLETRDESTESVDSEPDEPETSDTETGDPEVDEDATPEVATDATEASNNDEVDADLPSEPTDAATSDVVEGDAPDEEPVASDPEGETANNTAGAGEATLLGLLPIFGITDVEAAIECIENEAAAENLSLEEITSGEANGAMIATVRCRPEEMREMLSLSFSELETSSMAATPGQLTCGFDTLMDWFPTVPLAQADAVFSNNAPAPEEIVNLIADACGMSTEDADFFLNQS